MQLHVLTQDLWFPHPSEALPDGLLALGGDLSPERLLLAYRNGIFPWFNEKDPILWWSPDPRCVLFPPQLKVSRSMQQVLRKGVFEFRINTSFEAVIAACSAAPRPGQDGTWITGDIREAYTELHRRGIAWSAEAWLGGELAGGLYGLLLGKVFCGESMFSRVSNASKFAFISWVRHLQEQGVSLIDCQLHTDHLESLGAEMIPREDFLRLLKTLQ
jgi:leucyl/phenylalanyl-tRNA--protein transferase